MVTDVEVHLDVVRVLILRSLRSQSITNERHTIILSNIRELNITS